MTTRNFRVKNGLSVGDITISASANTITGLATAAPSADGDVANKKYVDDSLTTTAITMASKTLTSPVLNGTLSGTAFLDEDNMASDSAIAVASQQSIKAYVDAQVTASDLDFQADSGGALSIDLDSETLTFTGGTGIDTSGSGNAVTFAIDSTVATLTGSQTLTNKTLTTPVISSISNTGTLTLPTSTDTLVGRATTDTLTNKTFDANGTGNSISNIDFADFTSGVILDEDNMASDSATNLATQQSIKAYVDAQVTASDLDFQADSGGALSIDLDSETLTFTGGTGIDTSGSGNAVTFAIDSTVTTLTGSQTLTNKTLTTPVISSISNTGTLTLPTSTDTLVGRATTDTLTNKTINSASNTITITESNISDLGSYITASSTDTLTNKTFNANGTGNSISNIEVADFAGSAIINVSETLASNDSDTALVTAGAIIDYVDAQDANIASDTLTFTNKTFNANGTGNSITNIEVADLASGVVDTDLSSVSGSDDTLASAKAIKAYVDSQISTAENNDTTITDGNSSVVVADSGTGSITLTADGNTELVVNDTSATFSGNVIVSGDFTVNGTTTTVATTNTVVSDSLMELGNGTTGAPANDAGLVIERGDSNNAFIGFDESEDKFRVGTGTFTGASTGNLTITTGTLLANIEGNVTGAVTGNASTATTLETARTIGGVSFNGSANINLPGVNTTGNQDTSGTAAIATTVTVADESSDTSCNVIFTTAASGNLAPKSGTNLTFNSSNGTLTATTFSGSGASLTSLNGSNITTGTIAADRVATLNQNTTGSAATLTTARTIGGVSFNGSANIDLPGVNTTGNQNTSGTAAVATTVALVATNTTNATHYITFVDAATGNENVRTDTNLTYNPSTNVLTTTASAAQYADVAERFEADAPMEIGTVVEVGGTAEITEATSEMSQDVFGVISHKPAYMMNSGAGDDETHPFVAMTGRTPVRVVGAVTKGQRLVTSSTKGCARAAQPGESISPFNVIGRALETNTEAGIKLVNCAVRTNN